METAVIPVTEGRFDAEQEHFDADVHPGQRVIWICQSDFSFNDDVQFRLRTIERKGDCREAPEMPFRDEPDPDVWYCNVDTVLVQVPADNVFPTGCGCDFHEYEAVAEVARKSPDGTAAQAEPVDPHLRFHRRR